MAQKINVELIDDLDGKSVATETVTFGLDGGSYEIDLTDKNAGKLRDALAPFVAAGRRVGKASAGKRSSVAPSGPSAQAVRAWAVSKGMTVPERGRLPKDVVEAFEADKP